MTSAKASLAVLPWAAMSVQASRPQSLHLDKGVLMVPPSKDRRVLRATPSTLRVACSPPGTAISPQVLPFFRLKG